MLEVSARTLERLLGDVKRALEDAHVTCYYPRSYQNYYLHVQRAGDFNDYRVFFTPEVYYIFVDGEKSSMRFEAETVDELVAFFGQPDVDRPPWRHARRAALNHIHNFPREYHTHLGWQDCDDNFEWTELYRNTEDSILRGQVTIEHEWDTRDQFTTDPLLHHDACVALHLDLATRLTPRMSTLTAEAGELHAFDWTNSTSRAPDECLSLLPIISNWAVQPFPLSIAYNGDLTLGDPTLFLASTREWGLYSHIHEKRLILFTCGSD